MTDDIYSKSIRDELEALMPAEFKKISIARRRHLDSQAIVRPTKAAEEYERELESAYLDDHPEEYDRFYTTEDQEPEHESGLGRQHCNETLVCDLEWAYVLWRSEVEERIAYEQIAKKYFWLLRGVTGDDVYDDWKIDKQLKFIDYKDKHIVFAKTRYKRPFLQQLFRMKKENRQDGTFYSSEQFDIFKSKITQNKSRSRGKFNPDSLTSYFREEQKNGTFDILFREISKREDLWFFCPPVPPHINLYGVLSR